VASGNASPKVVYMADDDDQDLENRRGALGFFSDPFTGEEQQTDEGFTELSINSSCFSSMAYNNSTNELQMTFAKDGRSYTIPGIPISEIDKWVNSGSPGGYFNSFVRGNF
jgi:hypothetical protein